MDGGDDGDVAAVGVVGVVAVDDAAAAVVDGDGEELAGRFAGVSSVPQP